MAEDKTPFFPPSDEEATETASEGRGQVLEVGPYRLLQQIGEGGMGHRRTSSHRTALFVRVPP